jgi:hypothetical protein
MALGNRRLFRPRSLRLTSPKPTASSVLVVAPGHATDRSRTLPPGVLAMRGSHRRLAPPRTFQERWPRGGHDERLGRDEITPVLVMSHHAHRFVCLRLSLDPREFRATSTGSCSTARSFPSVLTSRYSKATSCAPGTGKGVTAASLRPISTKVGGRADYIGRGTQAAPSLGPSAVAAACGPGPRAG